MFGRDRKNNDPSSAPALHQPSRIKRLLRRTLGSTPNPDTSLLASTVPITTARSAECIPTLAAPRGSFASNCGASRSALTVAAIPSASQNIPTPTASEEAHSVLRSDNSGPVLTLAPIITPLSPCQNPLTPATQYADVVMDSNVSGPRLVVTTPPVVLSEGLKVPTALRPDPVSNSDSSGPVLPVQITPTASQSFQTPANKEETPLTALAPTTPQAEGDAVKADLWKRTCAIVQRKISKDELRYLNENSSTENILQSTRSDFESAQEAARGKFMHKVADRIGRILNSFDKYAIVVDVAIQHHPEFTSLAWAGVRFVLKIACNYFEHMEILELVMATVVEKMAICGFYATIYANTLKTLNPDLEHFLYQALPEFHASILIFSIKSRKHFDTLISTTTKIRSFFEQLFTEVEPLREDIISKEKAVRECAYMATMERIMENSRILKEMKDAVEDIRREIILPLATLKENLRETKEIKEMTSEVREIVNRLEQNQQKILTEFEENLADLKHDYLARLYDIDEFKFDLYVPAEATAYPGDNTRFDLFEKVQEFLEDNVTQKVCLIQGEAGLGKSTFNHHLAHKLWQGYETSPDSEKALAMIPLFIPLGRLYGVEPTGTGDFVAAYFDDLGFSKEQIKAARSTRTFAFILDGYDEIANRGYNFYVTNRLDKWNAKVVITTRPEYLGPDYHSKFHPPGKRHLLREYWLAPFSAVGIEKYIENYVAKAKTDHEIEYYKQIVTQPGVCDLISNPFLLRMVMAVTPAPSIREGNQIKLTRGSLYELFIDHWFREAKERLELIQIPGDQRHIFERLCEDDGFVRHGQSYCQQLALAMYRSQSLIVTYDCLQFKDFLCDDDKRTRILRFSSPLIREKRFRDKSPLIKEKQLYQHRFLHKSLRDYLVAQALWEDSALAETHEDALMNQFNIVDDSGVIDFIVDQAQRDMILQQYLFEFIEQSKTLAGREPTRSIQLAASNAITVLVKAGIQFTGRNLRGIQVSGADLSFGWFDNANLEGTNLSNVRLRNAWLGQACLKNAIMDRVDFGELPYFQTLGCIGSINYSPNGQLLAVGCNSGTVHMLSTLDNQVCHTFQLPHLVSDQLNEKMSICVVRFLPDRESEVLVVAIYASTVLLWSVSGNEFCNKFVGHSGKVRDADLSHDCQLLASTSEDATIRLWSIRGQLLYTFEDPSYIAHQVAFSPDGQLLASTGSNGTVKLWSVPHRRLLHRFKSECPDRWLNSRMAFSPDSQLLALPEKNQTVQLWSITGCQWLHISHGHCNENLTICFSPDGELLAWAGVCGILQVWSVPRRQLLHIFTALFNFTSGVEFSPDGKRLAAVDTTCIVRLWSVPVNKFHHSINENHMSVVWAIDCSPDGQLLATASSSGDVKLWSVFRKKLLHTFRLQTSIYYSPADVKFSPDSQFLTSAFSSSYLALWSVPTRQLLKFCRMELFCSIAFSPDNQLLSLASFINTVNLWSVQEQKLLHKFESCHNRLYAICFSPDSHLLASGGGGSVQLWSVIKHRLLHTFQGHSGRVMGLDFSPDGQLLASASDDYTVRLWSIAEKRPLHIFKDHRNRVYNVAFSPDGQLLASASFGDTMRLWSIESREHLATISSSNYYFGCLCWHRTMSNLLITGGSDGILRYWRLNRKQRSSSETGSEYELEITCEWASGQNVLELADSNIEGVSGLSPVNYRLMKQRGALGKPKRNDPLEVTKT